MNLLARYFSKDGRLLRASKRGDVKTARRLLERGANVHARDRNGFGSLHLAALHGDNDLVELLLDRHAYIGKSGINTGWTPLHLAISHAKTAKHLLDRGACVDEKDPNGDTALQESARRHFHETVEILLQHGAKIQAKDRQGWTVLDLALGDTLQHEEQAVTVEVLLEHGARSASAGTPVGIVQILAREAKAANIARLKRFASLGVDLDAKNENGDTLLLITFECLHRSLAGFGFEGDDARVPDLVEQARYLSNRADVNCKDKAEHTPLFYVAHGLSWCLGHRPQDLEVCAELLKILLDAGALERWPRRDYSQAARTVLWAVGHSLAKCEDQTDGVHVRIAAMLTTIRDALVAITNST